MSRSVVGEVLVVKVSGWRGFGSSRSLVGEAEEVKVSG